MLADFRAMNRENDAAAESTEAETVEHSEAEGVAAADSVDVTAELDDFAARFEELGKFLLQRLYGGFKTPEEYKTQPQ